MIKYVAALLLVLACTDGTGPGGRPTIVFTSIPLPVATSGLALEIYVMDSLGGHVRDITRNLFLIHDDGSGLMALTSGSGSEWGPDWSPDGAKIAFIQSSHLSVMNADGTGATPLLNDAFTDDHPSLSPDGRIAFYSNRSGGGHIYVINSNATGLTSIGDATAYEETPSWSPDGSRIAFSSNRDTRAFQIWTMNPDGSNPMRLTSDSGGNTSPAWSPDGSKIVFAAFRDSVAEIYVMNADGSAQTRLTHIPGVSKNQPRWRP